MLAEVEVVVAAVYRSFRKVRENFVFVDPLSNSFNGIAFCLNRHVGFVTNYGREARRRG